MAATIRGARVQESGVATVARRRRWGLVPAIGLLLAGCTSSNVRYGLTAFAGDGADLMPVAGVASTGAGTVQLDSSTDGGSTWSRPG